MVNKAINIEEKRATIFYLGPLNTTKTMTYGVVNPGPGLGQAQKLWQGQTGLSPTAEQI